MMLSPSLPVPPIRDVASSQAPLWTFQYSVPTARFVGNVMSTVIVSPGVSPVTVQEINPCGNTEPAGLPTCDTEFSSIEVKLPIVPELVEASMLPSGPVTVSSELLIVMITVSGCDGALLISVTTSVNVRSVGVVTNGVVNVGEASVGSDSGSGPVHANVSGSPSGSDEPVPSSKTNTSSPTV